jgi:hypothetical protein
MINNLVSLDFYNSSFLIRLDSKEYFWNSISKFKSDTNYPYTDTVGLLSYEPERGVYNLEYTGGAFKTGSDLPEIKWFIDNKAILIDKINALNQAAVIIITLEMTRNQKLFELDWVVQRHQEQLDLNIPTSLTNEQYIAVLTYKQQLRNLTNTYSKDTPTEEVTWPTNPLN